MKSHASSAPDPRALKMLFDTYWTSAGWRDEKQRAAPSPGDFDFAKRAGVMFDDVRLSHDDIVERARAATRAIDRRTVADAFAVSLPSRRLELRSALGSFAVLQHFPRHAAVPPAQRGAGCPVCGAYSRAAQPEDLNVLSFERFKWGGVRHDDPLYAAFDLEQFARLPPVSPTAADVAALRALLNAIEAAPPKTSAAKLEKHLAKTIRSNKAERDIVVNILGVCGILATAAHPGYRRDFVRADARELPDRHYVDTAYPACWWTRAHGIDDEAVTYWFGHLL